MLSITLIITAATVIVSVIGFSNQKVVDDLLFTPPAITNRNQWYRFLSCALVHADVPHLAFNMIAFYSFGEAVENTFTDLFGGYGTALYIALYVISQFLCLVPTFIKNKDNYYYRSLGASGAVSAVIFAGILLFPLTKIFLFFIPIGIPGFIFGFIYLGVSAYLERKGGSNVNHSAHLFGALAGIILLLTFGFAYGYDIVGNFMEQIRAFFN